MRLGAGGQITDNPSFHGYLPSGKNKWPKKRIIKLLLFFKQKMYHFFIFYISLKLKSFSKIGILGKRQTIEFFLLKPERNV